MRRQVWAVPLIAQRIPLLAFAVTVGLNEPVGAQQARTLTNAPPPRRGSDTSIYHGVAVADPYRWLENLRSPETRGWIRSQDSIARAFAAAWPSRDSARAAIGAGNVPLIARVPVKEGGRYFFTRTTNTGATQAFSLLVKTSRDAPARLVIDGDMVYARDSVRVRRIFEAPDGRSVAYAVARGGSQVETIRIRDIDTGLDLPDHIEGAQATAQVVWARQGKPGFFYARFSPPERLDGSAPRDHPRIMFHELGAPQSRDVLVFERPEHPEWVLIPQVTDDGRYLLIFARVGIERRDRVYVRDLTLAGSPVRPLTEDADAELWFIGSSGHEIWFLTDYKAPHRRIIAVDVDAPQRENWKDLIPEGNDVIDTWTSPARAVGDKILVLYRSDGVLMPRVFDSRGRFLYTLAMPARYKSIWSMGGRQTDAEAFYAVQDVADPNTVYSLDTRTGKATVFDRPRLPYEPNDFVTEQVFYTSRDGTRVPMFVMRHKSTKLDGSAPGLLYGYGFDAWIGSPWWQPMVTEFMRRGGVWALANVRGGGEYGAAWAESGRRRKKQTSIDDYLAASEWLQASHYVARGKLVANSSSAGGVLAAAAIQQRPDLFAAAILDYPVIDMFRYHLFKGGARWTQEYGTVDDAEDFAALRAYAPLQKVQPGTCYPPTMLAPGELDQVATPMHAYKFAAALEYANASTPGCRNPVLLRVSWDAGHQAGATPNDANDAWADQIAFIFRVLANANSRTEPSRTPGHVLTTSPDTSTSCGPAWSPRGDRIAFHSDRAGVTGIYTVDTLGADLRPVVADSVWSGYVAWSPDGSRLAFSRGPYGHRALFVATANGRLLRQLTSDSANAHWPSWSANGKSLVFNWDGDGNREIYRVPASGGVLTRLTSNSAHDDLAKWAPRDSAIVFDSNRDSTSRVYVMRVDGSQQNPIAVGAIPVFSPNGKRIAFQASPLNKGVSIFVMSADGSARRQLTFGEASDVEPSWSPDGTHIAFCSNRSGRYQIWTMRANGTELRRLTGPPNSQ